jgi:hypothetical protein
VSLTPSPKRTKPVTHDLGAEADHLFDVRGHGMVREVPAHDRLDPLTLLRHGPVASPKKLLSERLQLRAHSFVRGVSQQQELPRPRLPADMREAEEIESFRLALPACATCYQAHQMRAS